MHRYLIFHLLVFLLLCTTAFAQREADIWYFGKEAGLGFSGTNTPQPLLNSTMATMEGSSVVSDANGQLLFYTNGIAVWDRNHTVMNTTNLKGHTSASQSTAIVRHPANTNLYYIFVVDAVESWDIEASYSVVDMTLRSGNGGIAQYNESLTVPGSPNQKFTEKLTVIRHTNGYDLWVLIHGWANNSFYAYRIGSGGINPVPVVSSVGRVHNVNNSNYWEAAGYMKSSPNGRWLAVAIREANLVELFRFDAQNGIVVSNPLQISTIHRSYGVEFSPNSNVLYVQSGNAPSTGTLEQFDLTAGNIVGSRLSLGSTTSEWWGGLQLAPDGKIYMARWDKTSLGVIDYPNTVGLRCNFRPTGQTLQGKLCKLGLPNFSSYLFFTPGPNRAQACETCEHPVGSGQNVSWGALQNVNVPFSHNNDACTLKVYYRKRQCGEFQDIKIVAIHRESMAPECEQIWNSSLSNPNGNNSSAQMFFMRWVAEEMLVNHNNYYSVSGGVQEVIKVRIFRNAYYSLFEGGTDCPKWIIGCEHMVADNPVVGCCVKEAHLFRCASDEDFQMIYTDTYSFANDFSPYYYCSYDPDLMAAINISACTLNRQFSIPGCP